MLLDSTLTARICDFGISRVQQQTLATTKQAAGTPAFMAPELFGHGRVSERCDVYSFGITLWECVTGQLPWAHLSSPVQIIYAVGVQRERPPLPPACPAGLAALISSAWEHRPEKRPSFEEALDAVRALVGDLSLPYVLHDCGDGEAHRTM